MRFCKTPLVAFLLGVFGLALAGCGADSSPVETGEAEVLNLTDEFGGYQPTGQAPGFGDPEVLGLMTEDPAAPVSAVDSIELDSLRGNPRFDLYTVAIRWGQLDWDSTMVEPTDWSGAASLLRGHLRILRLIRFERGQDSIIRPRVNPQEVSWVSQTVGHFDGLVFLIADPLIPDDTLSAAASFTFATGPYTETFSMADLADLDTIITVDDLGNQVAITAHRIEPDPCGKGFLEGVWRANNQTGKNGKFFGKWIRDDGSLAGHIRGHWGERGNGERVFFGKWITRSGVFKGFLRGTWRPDPDRPGHGFLRGLIFTRDKVEIGVMRGRYRYPPGGRGNGFFGGGWKLHCPGENPEP